MRESPSGSRGFETTGTTTEPKPTDVLFEKSRVPEINKWPETEQSDKPEASEQGFARMLTPCRDRRSGSNQKFTVLANRHLSYLQDAGRRCGCSSGDACAQGKVRAWAPVKARTRRWQQSPDGRWRASRLADRYINEQLDEMRRQDDRRVDGDRPEGPTPGLEARRDGEPPGRQVSWEAMPRRSRHDQPVGSSCQPVQGELHVREVRTGDALRSEARGNGQISSTRTAR